MTSIRTAAETIAWLVAIVYATIPAYWFAVHPFASYWRSRKGKVLPFLGLIWLAEWLIVGWCTARYRHHELWPAWTWLVWALLFPVGSMVTAFMFFRSAVRGPRVEWRGREYHRDRETRERATDSRARGAPR